MQDEFFNWSNKWQMEYDSNFFTNNRLYKLRKYISFFKGGLKEIVLEKCYLSL